MTSAGHPNAVQSRAVLHGAVEGGSSRRDETPFESHPPRRGVGYRQSLPITEAEAVETGRAEGEVVLEGFPQG